MNKKRKFGCEFEFSNEFDKIENSVIQAITKFYGKNEIKSKKQWYRSINNKKWDFKTDSSTGCELCTPVSIYEDIEKICSVLHDIKKNGGKVTKRDSIHVHVEVKDIKPENIILLWIYVEPFVASLFPIHRRRKYRDWSFCERIVTSKNKYFNVASFLANGYKACIEHHLALSFSPITSSRKTVEMRFSEGFQDKRHVRNLVKLFLHIIEAAKNINIFHIIGKQPIYDSEEEFFDIVNVKDASLKKWIIERKAKFS